MYETYVYFNGDNLYVSYDIIGDQIEVIAVRDCLGEEVLLSCALIEYLENNIN